MTDYLVGGASERRVPRTSEARNPREVAALSARRRGPSLAVWGMAMLIASEATLFGTFIGTYFYLRFEAVRWPPAGIPEPRVVVPLVLAGVLALTSLPMQVGAFAARAGRRARAVVLVAIAFVVQSGYLAYSLHDYGVQLHRFTPSTDAYGSIYYVMLGADHAHVFVGVLMNLWLLGKLVRGLTMYRANATQAIAWYWHAVNLLTLIVLGTLLSGTL